MSDDDPQLVIKGLAKAAGYLRGELGKRLRTKKVPTLRFMIDETGAQAEKVERILGEIAADDVARAETAATDGAEDDESGAVVAGGSSGLLLVDKPTGPTSFAAIARVRKLYGERQVGHAGTLNPMASGLLQILVGEATKLVPYLMGLEKEYAATARLGVTTDSYDAEGRVTAEVPAEAVAALTEDAIATALARPTTTRSVRHC